MITLDTDCLFFELQSGESVPLSAEMITVELTGNNCDGFDSQFVHHAAQAVFHYYKHDLGRLTVSVGEFAGALESILRNFGVQAVTPESVPARPGIFETDLEKLAGESGSGFELAFFSRLREEMRRQLRRSSSVVRFHGLRSCVKQLAGVRRWNRDCQGLHNRIVDYLRDCLAAEARPGGCALVVE